MLHTIAQLEGEIAAQRERADSARAAGEKEAAKLKLQLKRRARAARGDKEQGKTDHELVALCVSLLNNDLGFEGTHSARPVGEAGGAAGHGHRGP